MKIREVEVFAVSVPTIIPYALSFGQVIAANSVLVRIHTEDGLYGIGETSPILTFSEESPETVTDVLKGYLIPAIMGENPARIEYIHHIMDKAVKGNSFAKAAIDIALYDMMGRKFKIPLYELLGGLYRDQFPLLWPLMGGDAETNTKEAMEAVKRGFRSLMIKVGFLEPDEDVHRVAEVRKAIGNEIILIPDANQGWTAQTAIKCIKQMERYNIAWVEQPVPKWDIDGLVRVKNAVDVPISVDEGLCSMNDALTLVKRNAADIVSMKLQKTEGFCKAKKIAAILEAANVPIFINGMIEAGVSVAASLQFAATTPNVIPNTAALMSSLRLQDDIIVAGGLQIDNGVIRVTDRPGLGVELDEKKIARYSYHRKD